MPSITVNCKDCGKPFERPIQRGRPAVRCAKCREQLVNNGVATAPSNIANGSISEESIEVPVENEEEEKAPVSKKGPDTTLYPFRLMVGNLGLAYGGDSESEAVSKFNDYSRRSSNGFGQIGFESVVLWQLKGTEYQIHSEFKHNRG